MKKFSNAVSITLVGLLVCSASSVAAATPTITPIDMTDVVIAQKVVAEILPSPPNLENIYDYVADDTLDMKDVVYMEKIIAEIIEPPLRVLPADPVLSPELDQLLRENVVAFSGDKDRDPAGIEFHRYFGVYSGCEVIYVAGGANDAIREVWIGDFLFTFPSSLPLLVHKDGEFLAIEYAYDAGWLSDYDVADVWASHLYFGRYRP